jgi:hypothetical protein
VAGADCGGSCTGPGFAADGAGSRRGCGQGARADIRRSSVRLLTPGQPQPRGRVPAKRAQWCRTRWADRDCRVGRSCKSPRGSSPTASARVRCPPAPRRSDRTGGVQLRPRAELIASGVPVHQARVVVGPITAFRSRIGQADGELAARTSLTMGDGSGPRIVGGHGAWFELSDGREVIDASNTAAPLGHRHPEIVAAVRRAADAPVINEPWQWAEREQAGDDLASRVVARALAAGALIATSGEQTSLFPRPAADRQRTRAGPHLRRTASRPGTRRQGTFRSHVIS